MKSSFLSLVVLSLVCGSAFAQTKVKPNAKPATTKAKVAQPAPATKTTTLNKEVVEEKKKSSFDKFYERLKISYFGAYQGSSLGQWDELAVDEDGKKDSGYPHNVFNQISFNMNFGWKMNFVVNPRFTLNTAQGRDNGGASKGLLVLEDMLVGVQGTLYSSQDGKFNFWSRIGARLPTSRGSRAKNITGQPEIFSIITYDIDKKWQLGSYLQFRYWVYQQRFNPERFRIFAGPFVKYQLDDVSYLQLFYENYSENRNNWKTQNGKDINFKNYWSNVMLAYGRDITPKLNFMPFVGYMVNSYDIKERPLDPMWVGFWLSYQIK